MRNHSVLAAVLLCTAAGAFAHSKLSLAGRWKANFRDIIDSGTLYLELEDRGKGNVGGAYFASTGKSGSVGGREKGQVLKLTLTQEGTCQGYYTVTLRFKQDIATGTYSGRDCQGQHDYGVISIARANGTLSPPPLPPRTPSELDEIAWQKYEEPIAQKEAEQARADYELDRKYKQAQASASENEVKKLQMENELLERKVELLKKLDAATDPAERERLRCEIGMMPAAEPGPAAQLGETTLFDSQGDPVAYIDTKDEQTVYLWKGRPVAYLFANGQDTLVYGFNGRHLGWFEAGLIRNTGGSIVGFVKGAAPMTTRLGPSKEPKELKPLMGTRALPSLKPLYNDAWALVPLTVFLSRGRE
jgi:hypothetical protein